MRRWVRGILWIDGFGALAAGLALLALRRFFVGLYELPLDLIITIGTVNLAYAAFALTLAARKRRRAEWIAGLALANLSWTLVCAALMIRFIGAASVLGLAHVFLEGVWVAMLGMVEWRHRRELARG